ncbi:MAG: pilus assembly protein PilP [Bacteriovoracaceae bacterium]
MTSSFAQSAPATSEVEKVFKKLSDIEEPFELRDPFQPPKLKTRVERASTTPIQKGVFTNVPQLGQVDLDSIKITGVFIGPERRAFVKVGNEPTTFTIKEGMTLGPNEAEIKAILPGGIILVEKVTNIYGELEYLETVIPISK